MVQSGGLGVTGGQITFDNVEITVPLVSCGRVGALPDAAVTLRCPGVSGAVLGPGIHVLRVRVFLSDGSEVDSGAVWEILDAADQ